MISRPVLYPALCGNVGRGCDRYGNREPGRPRTMVVDCASYEITSSRESVFEIRQSLFGLRGIQNSGGGGGGIRPKINPFLSSSIFDRTRSRSIRQPGAGLDPYVDNRSCVPGLSYFTGVSRNNIVTKKFLDRSDYAGKKKRRIRN